MKQKVIIKLFMDRNDQRSRTKAFKIAVSQPGVESVAIQEGDNYNLDVVGEHIDAVVLTNCLRKKLGHAQLVSVGPVAADDNNASANAEASEPVTTQPQPYSYPDFGVPQYQVYEVRDPNPECCSIM
ncbi:hypothetical protein RND71_038019 [Anisodus tanguticus]|uniref:Uncharacterized protein n=1 Tax=Anisodus tanguticus TaxID=243964 RepID=A0AAE1URS7_9SOLA|nr:hypothetical protein RND71_038019 [Anisodus tanguticus]